MMLLSCAAGAAQAQLVDHQIPLNYNWHGMAHPGEGLFSSNSFNADASLNNYRSMADRGLTFDLTDPNSLGTLPIVGATGLTYSLFNTLGYSNTTRANAAANGLDAVIIANRLINFPMELTPGAATNNGPFPAWQPASAGTTVSASTGLFSSSPGVITVGTSGSHGFRAGDIVLVGGLNPSIAGNTYSTPHPLNGTFTIASLDATHFTYADPNGNAAAAGQRYANNVPASGLTVSTGTVTVTTNAPHGLAAGQTVVISGVSPVGYNGTQTVLTTPTTTTFTYSSATTGASSAVMLLNNATTISTLTSNTTSVTATCTGHGLTTGSSATISGSSIPAYNGTYTVVVPTSAIDSITSAGTTATATIAAGHPFTNGQAVTVTGASNTQHNVTAATITVPSATVSYLSGSGSTVTATTSATNSFTNGQLVNISGAYPAGYNGTYAITVVDTTHFTYSNATTGTLIGTPLATSASTFTYTITSFTGTSTGASGTTPNNFSYGLVNQGTMLARPSGIYGFSGFNGFGYALTSLQGNGAGSMTGSTGAVLHGLTVGQTITISNVVPASYNGTYTITAVPTTSSFVCNDPNNNTAATTGTFFGAGTADRTSTDQVTTLSAPVTVDSNTQLGLLYIGSNSGAPLDVVMTIGGTPYTSRISDPDWCGGTGDSAIIAGQGTVSQTHLTHSLGAPIYNLYGNGSVVTAEVGMPQGFATGNTVVISGETASGYNGTYTVASAVTATSQATTTTGLTSDGSTGTATFAAAPTFAVGQAIYISGANPATLNGVYVINGVGANTVTFPCSAIGTTTAAATCARNYFTFNSAATGAPAGTVIAVNNAVAHPSYRGVANVDADQLSTFGTATTSGCSNLRVSEAVIALPAAAAGQQLTSLAFRGTTGGTTVAWTSNTLTAIAGNGTFGAATTSGTHSLIPGQTIIIKGVTPSTWNGVYQVASVPTTSTFTFANTTATNATAFGTVERPGAGRGFSIHAATLRSGTQANASCSTPIVITTSPSTHTSDLATNNFFAAPSTPVVTADDTTPVWFSYTAPSSGTIKVVFSTCTTAIDTTIAVYTSCAGSPIAMNDDTSGCGTGGSSVSFNLVNNQTYLIRVAGKAGAKGTFTLHVDDTPSPANSTPATAAPAVSGTGTAGDNTGTVDHGLVDGFTTIAAGTDTIGVWYQHVGTASATPYTMEARTCLDGQDNSTSDPSGCSSTNTTGGGTCTPLPLVSGVTGVRTASCSSSTLIYPLDTTIAVYSGASGPPTPSSTPIASNDDGCSLSSRVQWTANPGTIYYIRVGVKASVTGNAAKYILHVDDPVHTDLPLPLQFNWNGICHGTSSTAGPNFFSEQCVTTPQAHENRTDLNGYRSISDRGLLFDPNGTTLNAFNYGGTIGYQGLQYQVYSTPLQLDIVHVQAAGMYRGGGAVGNFKPNTQTYPSPTDNTTQQGWLPAWLAGVPSTGQATYDHSVVTSSMTGLSAVFGANTKLGLIYNMTNASGNVLTFITTLNFTDGSSVQVTCDATDWYAGNGNTTPCAASLPATFPAGVETHRILGIYNAVQNVDRADAASNGQLKVVETIISTASLTAAGTNVTGRTLSSITFSNLSSTDAGTNLEIFAATLRDPASYTLNYPPSGAGTVTPNQLNAGGTGKMTVTVSRGTPPNNAISSVIVDASQIGLSSTFALNDSGTNGDAHANDNIWSRNVSFPINATPNTYTLPFTVTDSQGRQAMGNIIFSVVAPTGTLTPSTGVVAGTTSVNASFIFGTAGGISSVILDASQLGLSATLALNDSGTNGDTTANDGTWAVNFVPAASVVAGTYMIPYTITDTASNMATGNLSITIIPPPPANDNCTGAIALSPSTTYNGDNSQASSNDGAASSCQATVSKGVWFTFTPPTTGAWLVSTCGTVQDNVVSIWNTGITCADTATASNILACNDDGGVGCTGLAASLQTTLTAGSTYFIRMSSFGAAAAGGAYNIIVTPYVTGACCNNSTGACTLVASTACSTTTSNYMGDNVACPTTCPVTGACCNTTSGACTFIYGGNCPSGTLGGVNSACDANTCPASGTCCDFTSGVCTPNYSGSCSATGTFYSATTCTPTPCLVTGTCCSNSSGTCTTIYGGFCPNNTSSGQASTCGASTCPPVGSCCDNITGACSVIYGGVGCVGNQTFNSATACTATTCPQMQWACCFADGSCLSLYQFDCTGHSGAVWEPGQTCGVFTCPSCTNVLANPGAETGDMTGWTIDVNGGNGWATPNASGGQVHTGNYCFATSYSLSRRHQLIDLTQFLTAAQLDAAPDFNAGEYIHTRFDQAGQYYILIQLLAADQTTVIASFNDGTQTALTQIPSGTPWTLVSHTFTAYGPGVRYLRFEDGGRDQSTWAGNYGTHFDDAFAGPAAVTSACCSTSGCSVISNAACITAGGAPQGCGTSCSPSPCPGVCCRGATCNSAISQDNCSTNGALAGAFYATSSSVCNGSSTTSPCCYPDYNKANGITVGDIFDFLNDWFAGRKFAVVGGDGAHGQLAVQNIFDFLNAWFAGGC
jgi:hypothetical protein